MAKHNPNRVHWAKVYRLICEAAEKVQGESKDGKGAISLYEIAGSVISSAFFC